MFGKVKRFFDVAFDPRIPEECIASFSKLAEDRGGKISRTKCNYRDGDAEVYVANPDKGYRNICFSKKDFNFYAYADKEEAIELMYYNETFRVSINGFKDINIVDSIMNVFNKAYIESKLPEDRLLKNINVFIGHGRSTLWRDLKDHLRDQHGVNVIAYETGARGGYTIQEVIAELSEQAALALLIHTAEDVDEDGQAHARENVVHETGLFQGKLGFKRAIVIKEDGTNEFSNIAGLQQIRFSAGNIRETFGDVLAILRREFVSRRV